MRTATIKRKTAETDVSVALTLEGTGRYTVATDCGFLNHMLELFARHGGFDLEVRATGDTRVDDHHTVEDVAICLGRAFLAALGDFGGVNRYGFSVLPMDEALVLCAIDLSGRAAMGYDLSPPEQKTGTFDTCLVREFFSAFARELRCALHFKQLAGSDSHHIIEAAFKGLARALKTAVAIDATAGGAVPSTKGTLL